MSNFFERPTSDASPTDRSNPPQRPSLGMFMVAILASLGFYYGITGASPNVPGELLIAAFMFTGLFVVGRWIIQQALYMIRRNGGLHFDGLQ